MNTDTLKEVRGMLIKALTDFVKKNGEKYSDCPDYWINEYGMDEEGTDMVFNVSEHGGCCVTFDKIPTPIWDENYNLDERDRFESYAIVTLYTIKDDDGDTLMYYMFYNDGAAYDDEISEPWHSVIEDLDTEIIYKIYETILDNYEQTCMR